MSLGKKESIGQADELILSHGALAKEELERREKYNLDKQAEIDAYNDAILAGAKDDIERFKDRVYVNDTIIVKLLKHNWIDKSAQDNALLGGSAVSKVQKIMIETPQVGKEPKLIDNPLPYRFEGIIVAMDPMLAKKDTARMFTVGTLVRTISFNLKEDRYYFHDGQREWIDSIDLMNMSSNLFPKYEGYAKIHPGMIENIFQNPEELKYD